MNKIISLLIMCMIILAGCSKPTALPDKPKNNIYDPKKVINDDIKTVVIKKNDEWSHKADKIEVGIATFRNPEESLDHIAKSLLTRWNVDIIVVLTEKKDIHIELSEELNVEKNQIAIKQLEQDSYYMLKDYEYSQAINHIMIELDAIIYGKETGELPYIVKKAQQDKKVSYIIVINVIILSFISVLMYRRQNR